MCAPAREVVDYTCDRCRHTQRNDPRLTDKLVFFFFFFACLVGQNDAFAETSGILAGTFRRMNNMAERQGCRWLWYIVFIILVFWFFVVVWWFRR
jgi:hypothetical protein